MIPRALVIQSRPDLARAVSASLADVEVHAIVLSDGHAAVTAVETWDPHVVLVDLTLPPLDGWCVLAAVGARVDHPLLVVRVADASQVARGVALGADAWVDDDVHVVAAAGKLAVALAA